jgi:hypothetical protein
MGDRKSGNGGDTTTTHGGGQVQATITRSAALEASLMAVWIEIATLGIERIVVLDKDGNRLFAKDGKVDRVPYSLAESKRMRGVAAIHNHPTFGGIDELPTTFSVEDLRTAIAMGQSEENVCNPSMMASFQPLPTNALKRCIARTCFLRPLAKTYREMNKRFAENKKQCEKGVIDYEQAFQRQTLIYKASMCEARDYLMRNQEKYGYIYEERAL